jgi:hypothetical protein
LYYPATNTNSSSFEIESTPKTLEKNKKTLDKGNEMRYNSVEKVFYAGKRKKTTLTNTN